jgi:uncharacterized LabA/DUF88 family protein
VALRLGTTLWRNKSWVLNNDKLKALLIGAITTDALTEDDVKPFIQQKAVDMKMGIDITAHALQRLADTIVIISGDADIVPALKLARRNGMIVLLDPLWGNISPALHEHTDYLNTLFQKGERIWSGAESAGQQPDPVHV